MWLGRAVLGREQPFHPLALGARLPEGPDPSVVATETPIYAEVLRARAGRVAMTDFLATVTAKDLGGQRPNPNAPELPGVETVLSCLHTILEEEWEHLLYAARDLDRIANDQARATEGV